MINGASLFYDCIAKKKDRELSIWGLSEGWVPGQIRVQNHQKVVLVAER